MANLNGGGLQIVDITNNGPACHQHEEVSQHVLLLRIPERISKFSSILEGGKKEGREGGRERERGNK